MMKIADIDIEVIRKDIKNIHLAVYPPDGRVRISVPLYVDNDAVRLFAVSKLGWIKQRRKKFESQERLPPREYKNRESHYFLGSRYLLNVIEGDAPAKVLLRSRTFIDMYVRAGTPVEKRHALMNNWYRTELKSRIPELIEKWEQTMNLRVNEWRVKQMKTRWGSCNVAKKRIWLNLELAKKPLHCLEYVIVHEMIHFLEKRHNERFLHYMQQFLPNWKQLKEELNRLPASHADWRY